MTFPLHMYFYLLQYMHTCTVHVHVCCFGAVCQDTVVVLSAFNRHCWTIRIMLPAIYMCTYMYM